MDLSTLLGIILLIVIGVIVFWAVYYVWIIYSFLKGCARDIVKKLR